MKLTKVDLAIAASLWVGFTLLLMNSVGSLGYARDEGMYFYAAQSYGRWLELLVSSPRAALDRKAIDLAWAYNHEHPGLIKTLFALSHLVLQKRLHLFAMEGQSYRFPAMALAGMLVAIVYAWGAEARSRAAGIAAAIAIAAMPRVFFHAHLACFDVPVVALWTLCAYTFWRSLRRGGAKWHLLAGVTFGLVLNAKHNAWFFPIAAIAHAGITIAVAKTIGGATWESARAPIRRALASIASLLTVGPAVLIAMWPWLWHDTLPRLREWVVFQLNHEHYNMEFLGVTYFQPPMPRAYAFVMTVATVPGVTLLLFAVGLLGRARLRVGEGARLLFNASNEGSIGARCLAFVRRRIGAPKLGSAIAKIGPTADAELLWLLSIGVIYAAWLSPKTPIFGGTKHWMTAYPFIALFAGVGFVDGFRAARSQLHRWRRHRVASRLLKHRPLTLTLFGAVTLASPIVQTARAHPWALSAYTPLVGGAAGAATLGLNRGFWGYTTGAITGVLNAAPKDTGVYLHDTLQASWDMLRADGRVRRDLRGTLSLESSNLALYHHEPHMGGVEYQTWVAYETCRPAHIAGLDGVPVIWVYERPKK